MATHNLLVQPASGPAAREHYQRTVITPVAIDELKEFLDKRDQDILGAVAENGTIRMWGFESGAHGKRNWDKLTPGDLALFYQAKRFVARATIVHKVHNKALALHYWHENPRTGRTWEYVYFCNDVCPSNIPVERFNAVIGYEPNNVVQGAQVIDGSRFEELSAAEDDDQPWLGQLGITETVRIDLPIVKQLASLDSSKGKPKTQSLDALIKAMDQQLAGKGPVARKAMARLVIRNQTLSKHLKALRGYRCEICKTLGFKKANGELYAEAHHVEPLSQGGSPLSHNIRVVCPTCHRKLHFAHVEWAGPNVLSINKHPYTLS